MDTTGPPTFLAGILVPAAHAVHIRRRSAEIRQIAFEVRHLYHLLYLPQDALLRTTRDKLSLMSRDCAEGTASETSSVDIDRELNHIVG